MFDILLDVINNGIKEEDINKIFQKNEFIVSTESFKIKIKKTDNSSVISYDYI